MRALSIGFHDILENGVAGTPPDVLLYCLDRPEFTRHLTAMRQKSKNPIEIIRGYRTWTRGTPVFVTFDDGGASAHACTADELERCGWRGHFLITTDWIGRAGFMDQQQIRDLHERCHVIGSHSCSHPARMSQLSFPELLKEWRESCARLEDIIGARVSVASVPDGYYSSKVARAAAAAGIEVLFTSEPKTKAAIVNGCIVLGRYTIMRHMPPCVSGAIAAGQLSPRWRQAAAWQAKKAIKNIAGERYLTARQFLLDHGFARLRSQG